MAKTNSDLPMTDVVPADKNYLLTHYRQRFEWDCGLSCILMILPMYSRQKFLENFEQICTSGGFGCTTWTIDLCFILREFNITHIYLTKTLGVDPNYEQHSYYRNIISREEDRINLKFKEAQTRGMAVQKKSVCFDALVRHLAHHGPIIMLTNAALLTCDNCRRNQFFDRIRYSGHYVVACSYDLEKMKVKYRNPAQDNHLCITSFESMEKARTAYGTDEDTILLFYST